MCTSTHNTQHT